MIFRTATLVSLFTAVTSAQEVDGACSICGEGLKVGFADAVFIFPGQPSIPCGVLEEAAMSGQIPLIGCETLPGLVEGVCECELAINPTDAPFAPAMTPEAPATIAPVTGAPVTMAPVTTTMAPVTTTMAPVTTTTMAPVTTTTTMAPVTLTPVTMTPVTMAPAPATVSPVMVPVTAAPISTPPISGATRIGMCIATLASLVGFLL